MAEIDNNEKTRRWDENKIKEKNNWSGKNCKIIYRCVALFKYQLWRDNKTTILAAYRLIYRQKGREGPDKNTSYYSKRVRKKLNGWEKVKGREKSKMWEKSERVRNLKTLLSKRVRGTTTFCTSKFRNRALKNK